MKKLYMDMTEAGCTALFAKDAEIVPAGTTIYSMPVKDKNPEYQRYADLYDFHFIFDDDIPSVDFYAIPFIDIVAIDSQGGYIGTVGERSDLHGDAPICYIDKDRNCYYLARCFREIVQHPENWRKTRKPLDGIEFYTSKEDAMKRHEFIEIPSSK